MPTHMRSFMREDTTFHDRTSAGTRTDREAAPEPFGTPLHAREPGPVQDRRPIESTAVVRDSEDEFITLHCRFDLDAACARMTRNVVHGLLEDQQRLSPHVGADREIGVGR